MSTEDYTQAPWGAFGRDFVLAVIAGGSKVVLQGLNSVHVNGLQRFHQAVMERESGTPLFTISNHTSTLDDPTLFAAMLPLSFFWNESHHQQNRWTLCAKEMCYKNSLLGNFFQNGKTLPIERGQGPNQPIMRKVAELAAKGDWVHVFPEARIGYTGTLGPLKWGIGKLICDAYREDQPAERQPIVIPFYHSGMGRVLPKGSMVPRVGHQIHVEVGEAVHIADLLPNCKCSKQKELEQVWVQITDRIAGALTELERKAPPNLNQKQNSLAAQSSSPPPVQTTGT